MNLDRRYWRDYYAEFKVVKMLVTTAAILAIIVLGQRLNTDWITMISTVFSY